MVSDEVKGYTKDFFETFGADVMITDQFKIKLIEINEKPGFDSFKLNNKKMLFSLVK